MQAIADKVHDAANGSALAPPVRQLQYVTGDQIDAGDRVFDDELVEGLLTRHGISVIYGDSNSGKTFLAIDIAAAIAQGIQWMGRHTNAGIVLYLATEACESVELRVAAYKREFDAQLGTLVVVQSPINLFNAAADVDAVVALARRVESDIGEKVALAIGDTLATISAGANENSGEDMGAVMRNAQAIRAAVGCAFMWIHHTGKDAAKGMRGWSGMRAAIDTEIEVTVDDKGQRCAEVTKQRDLPGKGERIGFRLSTVVMGRNAWDKERTTCIVEPTDAPPRPVKVKRPSAIAGAIEVVLRQSGGRMKRSDLQGMLSKPPYAWTFDSVRNEVGKLIRDKCLTYDLGEVVLPKEGA
jgi:hypothetical protein